MANPAKVFRPPYNPHPGQLEFHDDPHRFRVLATGRRWGKTKSGLFELVRILAKAKEDFPIGWVVAPNYPLVNINWDEMLELMGPLILTRNIQDHWMEIQVGERNGKPRKCKVEFKSAEKDEQGLLGRGLSGAMLDEAKLISRRAWDEGVRPALADKLGRAVIVSSPKGRNFFYELYLRGQETSSTYDSQWKSWNHPTISNPYFSPAEWEYLKKTETERTWREEWMAEFLEESSEVFHGLSGLPICQMLPTPGADGVIGVDLARTVDWTVILVMESSGRVVQATRIKELNWSVQVRLIESIANEFPTFRLIIDSSGVGDPIEDSLRERGLGVFGVKTGTSKIKTDLIEGLQIAIAQKRIALPKELLWLWDELKDYTSEQLPTGHVRYTAPPGKHDDGVIALALCVYGLKGQLGQPIALPEQAKSPWATWDDYLKAGKSTGTSVGGYRVRPGILVRPW